MELWTPLVGLALISFLFALGNFISVKTRAYVSSIIPAILIFLILKYTNVIPANLCATAGLTGMVATFVIPFCVVDVGTMLNLRELTKEWKTAVTVVAASIGIMIVCFTLGVALMGWERAIAAIAPLTGALLATTIVQQVAVEAGANTLAAFVMIVLVLQTMAGLPVASIALKKYYQEVNNNGGWKALEASTKTSEKEDSVAVKKMFPPTPESWKSDYMMIFKIAIIGVIAFYLGNFLAAPTKNIVTPTLLYIILGLISAELGLLERAPLDGARSRGIIFLALFSVLLSTFESVSLEALLEQVIPSIIIILVGLIGIIILSAIAGKIFKTSPWLSIAIGTCCYLGYPGSQIVVEETIRSSGMTEEEAKIATSKVLPKMIIGYICTAIVSIICAGIIAPMIFK